MSGNSTRLTLEIGMCGESVRDLPCMQLASYLERSPLMWKTLLHLYVNLNEDDCDDKIILHDFVY